MRKMNRPTPNDSANAMSMSGRLTAVTFSRKLDLKIVALQMMILMQYNN